jgi:hypothetical protein
MEPISLLTAAGAFIAAEFAKKAGGAVVVDRSFASG